MGAELAVTGLVDDAHAAASEGWPLDLVLIVDDVGRLSREPRRRSRHAACVSTPPAPRRRLGPAIFVGLAVVTWMPERRVGYPREMTIDDCQHDFASLATKVLPTHLKKLKAGPTRRPTGSGAAAAGGAGDAKGVTKQAKGPRNSS